MSQARLILASASPRRKALLDQLGVSCTCAPADIDESHWIDEKPSDYVQRMAQEKAQAIALFYPPLSCAVLAADTIVVIAGTILGKPGNHQQAVKQLTAQAGKRVLFHSGLAIVRIQADGEMQQHSLINTTEVTFRPLSQKQIEQYLLTEQPYDCAGSFKVEGLGISLFTAINSNDPTSLIGLPLIDLCSALPQFSINII